MRKPLQITSVRGRLTLWSIGVLALTLIGCALTVHFTVRASLLTSIDQDLAHEAQGAFLMEPPEMMVYKSASAQGHPNGVQRPAPSPLPPSHSDRPAGDQERIDREMPPLIRLKRDLPPKDIRPDVGFQNAFFAKNLFSERHRFVLVRLRDPQGKILSPPSGEGGLDRSAWDRQFELAGDRERYATLVSDNQEWRVLTMPHKAGGQIVGIVQVSYPLQELNSLLRGLDRTLFILIPLALLVAGIGGAGLTDRALRPVRQISRAAMEVEASDLSRRLSVTGGDEFAELATTFNGMFERLQAAFARMEDSVRQQQRFTADASHELRTPLTTVKANADWALRKRRRVAEYQEALSSIVRAVDRTDQIIESLLCLARSDSESLALEQRPLSLLELLQKVVATAPRDVAPICLDLSDPTLGVVGSAEQLERVFLNLLQNALRHTPADGVIRLSAHAEQGERVVVTVEDTGEGIPPEHLPYVCERFYRVDAARSRPEGGAGLGLAICQSIVQAHGGTMQIESAMYAGTRVSVGLPLVRAI
ncbi:MAG: integral rane sensor signal transduction histidine kinase [Chthonomonadaceae bacterium]|nr:integral rane sensor signal transduction histidine kinase [Chthonomonadaceae bacterium]